MAILKSFKRGAWTAHVSMRPITLRVTSAENTPPFMLVRLDHPGGYLTQWPVQYDDGRIGYDWADMPRDGQRATKAAFRWISAYLQSSLV